MFFYRRMHTEEIYTDSTKQPALKSTGCFMLKQISFFVFPFTISDFGFALIYSIIAMTRAAEPIRHSTFISDFSFLFDIISVLPLQKADDEKCNCSDSCCNSCSCCGVSDHGLRSLQSHICYKQIFVVTLAAFACLHRTGICAYIQISLFTLDPDVT